VCASRIDCWCGGSPFFCSFLSGECAPELFGVSVRFVGVPRRIEALVRLSLLLRPPARPLPRGARPAAFDARVIFKAIAPNAVVVYSYARQRLGGCAATIVIDRAWGTHCPNAKGNCWSELLTSVPMR
jgi:hypothetical protein